MDENSATNGTHEVILDVNKDVSRTTQPSRSCVNVSFLQKVCPNLQFFLCSIIWDLIRWNGLLSATVHIVSFWINLLIMLNLKNWDWKWQYHDFVCWWIQLVAEVVGTYFLIFAGCASVVVNKNNNNVVTLPGISIVWGLVVMVLVYSVGHISGAHFNPAVTIAFASTKRFPLKQVNQPQFFSFNIDFWFK